MSIINNAENGGSASRVTRYASRIDFSFHGKWLVRYDPGEFAYPDILTLLPALQTRLQQQKLNYKFLNVNFSRTIPRNRYFPVGNHLFIGHNGNDRRLLETDPGAFAVQPLPKALGKPIRSLSLLFPRLESDPRWQTIGLPAAQLFLASCLQAGGFKATPLALVFPAGNPPHGALEADMAGFTIFEDLLPSLRPFLARFRAGFNGIIAAGGPFPTLAPLAAIYHLPQVNLFLRGEVEMELPGILEALNQGDAETLYKQTGLFWQQPGLIVMSHFDRVNRPEKFSRFQVNFDFLRPEHLEHGLEMNFSRGCNRGCIFCCHAQGRKYRNLPLDKAEELLKQYRDKVDYFSDIRRGVPLERPVCIPDRPIPDKPGRPAGSPLPTGKSPVCIPVNINDDDILQDPAYAAAVFALIKKHGFRIHGIQTSPAALLQSNKQVNTAVLALAADPELYVDNRPLIWLGTDSFLPQRARRLGKRLPAQELFAGLLAELEKHGLRHFHYWISSDGESTWEEFSEELALICSYYRDFPNFGLLAHAPFIVPYPASRSFQRLPAGAPNLKIKEELEAPEPLFRYTLVERLETAWPNLNKLLRNEKAGGEKGFFDLLKEKNLIAVTQLAYHFLKQEQLQDIGINRDGLMRAGERMAKLIESII